MQNVESSLRLFSFCLKKLRPSLSVLFLVVGVLTPRIWALPQSTTTLTATSSGASVTTISSGSVVALQATVTMAGAPVTVGQVTFCDASAAHCSDIHALGTAQLTSAGTAILKFVPGIGNHSYKAVFYGRFGGSSPVAGSSSGTTALTVTGTFPTTTSITSSGSPGNYSLTATVTGIVNSLSVAPQAGPVSFLDTTNSNYSLSTASLGGATAGLSFTNSSSPQTVTEPNVVAAADFNGDGIPDLAVSNSNSGETALTILLGKGDGTFSSAASPTVGLFPDSIVVADFNSDGVPDLALSSVDQNIVTVLLGNGDGTFKSASNLQTVSTPQSVASGDFNGDGIADLAVVNANSVLIFLGKGDGTFTQSSTSSPTGMSPITVAVGDLNGDGIPDLAVVNSCGPAYPCDNNNGTVTILLGKGDGTFSAVSATPVSGSNPVGIAIADLNGDGILDLAVTNYDAYSTNAVTVFLGNGDGTFQTGLNLARGFDPRQIVVGDFNGDGKPDLAFAGFWSGVLTVIPGNGDGTFGASLVYGVNAPLSTGYLAVADFNGDGVQDLAIPNQDINGTVSVQLAQPTQTATASVSGISIVGTGVHQIEAEYSATSGYDASNSATISLTAQPLATTLNLIANPPASFYANQVALTATLAPYSGQDHSTNGEAITFYSGATSLGTAPLSSGVAILNVTSLPTGTDTLTASFAGDTNFTASTSAALSYTVAKVTPAMSLSAAPNPVALQGSVTLTAAVSSAAGTPTGSVVFSDDNTVLGTVPLSTGAATLAITTLTAGSHSLTASYSGDSNFTAVSSGPVTEVVQGFVMNPGGSALSQTVQPGGNASYQIPVSPLGGTTFQAAISFTSSGLPAGATAAFSPQTIAAGSAATNVTLTIQVPNQTSMLNPATKGTPALPMIVLSLLALPFWGIRHRLAKQWARWMCWMIMLSSGAILAGLVGCSGGGGRGSTQLPPAQTYTITVTATSGSYSETLPVTLTVE